MTIVKCAKCEKDIDLEKDAQTSCPGCKKDFCCAMSSTCFSDYHREKDLREGHSALTILDPTWKINLRCSNG